MSSSLKAPMPAAAADDGRARPRQYAIAVAAVAAAVAITAVVPLLRDRLTFFAFWPTIFLVSFLAGTGPGILTTILSALAVLLLFPSVHTAPTGVLALTVVAFAMTGTMAAVLAEWRWRKESQLLRAAAQADQAMREAESANRAKDAFLATVSHELRTPLSPILAWVSMLRSGELEGGQVERALEVIDRNARMQAQLVEDLLDVSRIIEGKMRLHVRPVPLAGVIHNAIETVRPAAEAKEIRLQIVLDSTPCTVSGDPDRLQQIVWNLLANAVKFTPKNGRVHIGLERVNSHVEISVADSGCGIAEDLVPHIFERFRQADDGPGQRHSGLGLGLSIVRHLVELHGGTVTAQSDGLDKGSRFAVHLPVTPVLQAVADTPRRHPTVGERSEVPSVALNGIKVLVVDDEPDSNEVVRMMLSSRGAEVRVAGSVAHAMEKLSAWTPDVLVCDIGMPGEDGYSMIARVRASREPIARLPAIALTAYAAVEDRVRLLSAGFQVHVAKPANPDELAAAVAAVTGRNLRAEAVSA